MAECLGRHQQPTRPFGRRSGPGGGRSRAARRRRSPTWPGRRLPRRPVFGALTSRIFRRWKVLRAARPLGCSRAAPLGQQHPTLLRLLHLVCGPSLHGRHRAGAHRLTVLAQGFPHGTNRGLGHRPGRALVWPTASLHEAELSPLLRTIGVAGPRRLDPGPIPRAVGLAADPAGLLGTPDCSLADPDLSGEPAIVDRPHPAVPRRRPSRSLMPKTSGLMAYQKMKRSLAVRASPYQAAQLSASL